MAFDRLFGSSEETPGRSDAEVQRARERERRRRASAEGRESTILTDVRPEQQQAQTDVANRTLLG